MMHTEPLLKRNFLLDDSNYEDGCQLSGIRVNGL